MTRYIVRLLAIASMLICSAAYGQTGDYPAPAGEPGAPFADPNLKLVVLSALLENGAIDLGSEDQLAEYVLGRPYDQETEGYEEIAAVHDYLVRYPLTDEMLKSVDTIYFDGGNSIYFYMFSFWHGEDDRYDVRSLRGIKALSNLTELEAVSMVETFDLLELAEMKELEKLSIGVDVKNLPTLAELESLKVLEILNDEIFEQVIIEGHPTRVLMDDLKSRGVDVWVHWVSSSGENLEAFR